jgi:hypothetical protein
VLVEVPAEDAADLEIGADVEVRRAPSDRVNQWPERFGALAGELPSIELEDIRAARRGALQGKAPKPRLRMAGALIDTHVLLG